MLRLTRTCVLALLALPALFTGAGPATAGDDPLCASTQAAIELRSCGYCREIKDILSDTDFVGVSFEVTPLRVGATVQMGADTDEARLLMQEFVAVMWGDGLRNHPCDYCNGRQEHLAEILVDWTFTDSGLHLVLITEDPALAQWALADARSTRGWVLGSAAD